MSASSKSIAPKPDSHNAARTRARKDSLGRDDGKHTASSAGTAPNTPTTDTLSRQLADIGNKGMKTMRSIFIRLSILNYLGAEATKPKVKSELFQVSILLLTLAYQKPARTTLGNKGILLPSH